MGNKTGLIGLLALIIIVIIGGLFYARLAKAPTSGAPQASTLDQALANCKAYPNDSTQHVTETSRLTIYLPKQFYPNESGLLSFTTASGTATAGYVSNGGIPGAAYGATPECYATYYEFNGNGTVVLTATSSLPNVPTYTVRFEVGQHQ